MGQACLSGRDHETIARALEALTPADILGPVPGQQRYTQLLNEAGGILDDLMVTLRPIRRTIFDAGRQRGAKAIRLPTYRGAAASGRQLTRFDDRGLLALQGPLAWRCSKLVPEVARCRS